MGWTFGTHMTSAVDLSAQKHNLREQQHLVSQEVVEVQGSNVIIIHRFWWIINTKTDKLVWYVNSVLRKWSLVVIIHSYHAQEKPLNIWVVLFG